MGGGGRGNATRVSTIKKITLSMIMTVGGRGQYQLHIIYNLSIVLCFSLFAHPSPMCLKPYE